MGGWINIFSIVFCALFPPFAPPPLTNPTPGAGEGRAENLSELRDLGLRLLFCVVVVEYCCCGCCGMVGPGVLLTTFK